MAGIFISYRKADTGYMAAVIYDYLSKRFDPADIFMDRLDIRSGARFEDELNHALTSCDVLLALIGPNWVTCTRSNGVRRLDLEDDWVRNEIATALHRKILVVPVLLSCASLPDEQSLPPVLRPLREHQAAEIADDRLDEDVRKLARNLRNLVPTLKRRFDDVDSADNGLRLLIDLISKSPVIAESVGRSKEIIENTQRQVDKLELYKKLHAAFHDIESRCYHPLTKSERGVSRFRGAFLAVRQRIERTMAKQVLNSTLVADIVDHLNATSDAFQAVVADCPDPGTYEYVRNELKMLLASLPARLNRCIVDAAEEIQLDRLAGLMATVSGKLTGLSLETNSTLSPFLDSVSAIERMNVELKGRVSEHRHLQRLDSKLRSVCSAQREWNHIKLLRSRLVPPVSEEMMSADVILAEIEADIVRALADGNELEATDLLKDAYFMSVSSVFQDVDTSLKDHCLRLSEVNESLKTILDMCSGQLLPQPDGLAAKSQGA